MTLYENGTILTMEEQLYAEALLEQNGAIRCVGTIAECEQIAAGVSEELTRVDLAGHTLMPSFIDVHSHFSSYASSLLQVPLEDATNFDEIAEKIEDFRKINQVPARQWIIGKGYDHNELTEKVHPSKQMLDQIASGNPVVLMHKSGHVGVFNSMALSILGVTVDTKELPGGRIEKKNGELTGYMEETAFMYYLKQVPMPSFSDLLKAYVRIQEKYASYGITTVQEGMMVEQMLPLYQALLQEEILTLDLVGYPSIEEGELLVKEFKDHVKQYKKHFKIGGYKTFLDGSPQGRTAWMRTPYQPEENSSEENRNEDARNYCGYGTITDDALLTQIKKAASEQMQILAHCNGDAACEQYIKAVQRVEKIYPEFSALRPVMIHAQLLDLDQLPRVKKLGIFPSFFVAHVYYWGETHCRNFGVERASRISPTASAFKQGIRFTFHQDAPVVEPDMLETIWCAVNRKTKRENILGEEERLPVIEALKAVTIHAAYQYFEEDQKGSLKNSKLADMVVLERNPLTTDKSELRNIQVLETIKNGKSIYRKV